MTEKRFDLVCDNNVEWLMQEELFLPIMNKYTNKKITLKQCYDLLNSLAQEEQLKKSDKIIYLERQIEKLKEENKKLQSKINCENIYFGYLRILYDWNKKVEKENKELKNDEKQLSIDFLDYKMKLRKVLRNHYLECQKWSDTHTQLIIKQIASDLEL